MINFDGWAATYALNGVQRSEGYLEEFCLLLGLAKDWLSALGCVLIGSQYGNSASRLMCPHLCSEPFARQAQTLEWAGPVR